MRKHVKLLTIILIFVFLFSNIAGAINLKDVPKDHWAYESVKKLVEEGYLTLYDDDTFSGEKNVTRYELAVLVARILDNLSNGKKQADEQDIDTIRKLSLEFRDELVEIAQTQDVFSESIAKIEKKMNIIENENLTEIYEKLYGLEEKTNKMDTSITANEKEIEKIIDTIVRIKTLEEKVANLQTQVNSLKEEIARTGLKVEEKENLIEELRGNINKDLEQQIDDQHSITLTRIQALENRINELENKLATYEETSEKPEKKDGNTTLYLGAAALIILLAGMN